MQDARRQAGRDAHLHMVVTSIQSGEMLKQGVNGRLDPN
jgi:hypothetical protein